MIGIFVFSIHLMINIQEAFEARRANYIDASFMIRASTYVRILFLSFFLLLSFNELDLIRTYIYKCVHQHCEYCQSNKVVPCYRQIHISDYRLC